MLDLMRRNVSFERKKSATGWTRLRGLSFKMLGWNRVRRVGFVSEGSVSSCLDGIEGDGLDSFPRAQF